MSRIRLSEGFTPIPEGTHVFKVVEVHHDETFGKIEIKLSTAEGKTHIERFKLVNDNGTQNDKAVNAFSFFVRTVMNDICLTDIDPQELVGHYIEAEVIHDIQPSKNDPTKTVTFVKLGDKSPASGFVNAASVESKASPLSALDILDNL